MPPSLLRGGFFPLPFFALGPPLSGKKLLVLTTHTVTLGTQHSSTDRACTWEANITRTSHVECSKQAEKLKACAVRDFVLRVYLHMKNAMDFSPCRPIKFGNIQIDPSSHGHDEKGCSLHSWEVSLAAAESASIRECVSTPYIGMTRVAHWNSTKCLTS